uniref:C2H2-type domain-containing protein n=1 Tax=Rhipicephalus appendiculatus TaxID=34631 RepID=A0A131YPJ6_RHIAP
MENMSPNEATCPRYACETCGKAFVRRCSLARHNSEVHSIQVPWGSFKCDQCHNVRYNQREQLLKHLIEMHQFEYKYEQRRFRSLQDFFRWKQNEERREKVCFVASSSAKTLYGGRIKRWYVCHRSGSYIPSGKGRRRLKSQGSCKINAHCMATMSSVQDIQTGVVTLVYQKKHYGHDIDLGHLRLSKEERQAIAQQLAQGIPVETVLKNVKKTLGRELQKIHLITRRDLNNIARRELGLTLPQLQKEGPNTPYLKDVKLELPSESSNSCSYDLDQDIDKSADHAPEGNENILINLPGVGFQSGSQLPLAPLVIGQQGTAPLVFTSLIPTAQNGSVIIFSNPGTTLQTKSNSTLPSVRGSEARGSGTQQSLLKCNNRNYLESVRQLCSDSYSPGGDCSAPVSQAKKCVLEAIHELHAKITKYSGSEDKLNHIEKEIRGLSHFVDFGVVNWEPGDCGEMEEISFDDEEEPQLQGLSESRFLQDLSEGQSAIITEKKSKPHRQDHVYSKMSE